MLISQNARIHHSFCWDPPANDLTLAKGRSAWQRMLSIRCLFAVIPLFSWLLFLPLWRGRTRVSAANRISVADNSLQKQQKQPASLREGCPADMRQPELSPGDRLPFFLQGRGRGGAAGAVVPAAGVAQIAFDAVQVGVRPGAFRVGLLL